MSVVKERFRAKDMVCSAENRGKGNGRLVRVQKMMRTLRFCLVQTRTRHDNTVNFLLVPCLSTALLSNRSH